MAENQLPGIPEIPTAPGSEAAGGFFNKIRSLTDMSTLRKGVANLLPTPSNARNKTSNTTWLDSGGKVQDSGTAGNDWRIRVSVSDTSGIFYRNNNNTLLEPLRETSGVIFPITPQINITHTAKYSSSSPTHSNYASHFYEGSEVGEIQINGDFPIQSSDEAQYLLAVIYFFRSATKMFWGEDSYAGAPPPVLFLDGYGSQYFPHVPCILKSFTHSLPNDVDYIECQRDADGGTAGSKKTRLPVNSSIQITLQPIYSRARTSTFNNADFANGKLLDKGFM